MELSHDLLESKVQWQDCGNTVDGVVRGVYYDANAIDKWRLLVQITGARGFGAGSFPVNSVQDVALKRVTITGGPS
jgi:hypothetical protein